jgi:membrane-associated protease RseP (regulator of RpoE activity)
MKQRYHIHILLFLVTVFTTMVAGAELIGAKAIVWPQNLPWQEVFLGMWDRLRDGIWVGAPFSFSFLLFLTVHEFGHYFTAVYHKVRCTLPYYIPIYIPGMPMNIGSFGAVIRIKEVPSSRRKYFDIGVAGPLAGFVIAVGLLIYGFTNLPPMESTVLGIHPEYQQIFGGVPTEAEMAHAPGVLRFGGSILYEFLRSVFAGDANMPPSFEIAHYPFLFVGFLTLFFTALNLLPIGQLDGGHVTYGLFGARIAGIISRITVLGLLIVGGIGMVTAVDIQGLFSGMIWYDILTQIAITLLYFAFLYYVVTRLFAKQKWTWRAAAVALIVALQFVITLATGPVLPNIIWLLYAGLAVRLIGLNHPIAPDDTPLTLRQKVLGWIAIVIFILCFSPNPISLTTI